MSALPLKSLTTVALLLSAVCSLVLSANPNGNNRIVGGGNRPEHYPSIESLVVEGEYQCAGAILDHLTIVTVAQCVIDVTPSDLQVHAGTSTLSPQEGVLMPVTQVVIHPHCVGTSAEATPVQRDHTAAQLPEVNEMLPQGPMSVMFGWGSLVPGGPLSDRLKGVPTKLMPLDTCRASFNRVIADNMICTNYQGNILGGLCDGDRVAPLIHFYLNDDEARVALLGLVSVTDGCGAPKKLNVFANVAALRPFIDETLAAFENYHCRRQQLATFLPLPLAVLANKIKS